MTRVWRRWGLALVCVPVGLLALSGCSSEQDSAVRDVASRFYTAVGDHDGVAACQLLAPSTRSELEESSGSSCDKAVMKEKIPAAGDVRSVDVFETMAQIHYASDTVFLARFQTGWRVLAAACKPAAHDLYECSVKGA